MSYFLKFNFNNSIKTFFKLLAVDHFLQREFNEKNNLGAVRSSITKKSLWSSFIGIRASLNNLGNVYTIKNLDFSRKIEKEVIEWGKKLINASSSTVEGYISSGGTESNLFLMWMGREWLKQFSSNRAALITSGFTHYSVSKGGRIIGTDRFITATDENNWGMDIYGLEETLDNLIKKGYQTFLIPVTLGYSSTGAVDPLEKIIKLVDNLQKKSKIKCFVWVDAAMQGLPLAYLDNQYSPLKNSIIKGYVLDSDKLGLTPVPSGIVLYRKSFRKFIEKKIDYLDEVDATLLGSRPGFPALAIWSNLVDCSQIKWRKRFFELNQKKLNWISKLKDLVPGVKIISTPNSLTVGIVVDDSFPRLPRSVENHYGLSLARVDYKSNSGKTKTLKHYKIFFLSPNQNHNKLLEDIVSKKKTV
ncbi:aminotransferase class I/II-fold pyridoxal phosphate-dependent enzyme [Candidatus Woesearchaeota archaeon]|nr:aminotransferase class I/II-fold pyridoxal phosphate-dependent enzyme [Candidatus Woesearchaeota archaeon]